MKRLMLVGMLAFVSATAQAEAVMSCEEVDQMGEALTTLGIAMDDENAEIGLNSPEDAALRDVVEGLATIAAAENDEDLANASIAMAEAWDNADRDAYTDALATAVAKLAIISVNECEQ